MFTLQPYVISPLSNLCCFEQSIRYSKDFRYIFQICGGQLLVLGGMYSFSFADFPMAFAHAVSAVAPEVLIIRSHLLFVISWEAARPISNFSRSLC